MLRVFLSELDIGPWALLLRSKLFLRSAGVAINARKLRILGVDVNEIVTFGIDLFKCFAAALGGNEMT